MIKGFYKYFLIIAFFCAFEICLSQQLTINLREKKIELYKESHALIIGLSDYKNGWRKLKGVYEDIEKVSNVLNEQGFTIHVYKDLDYNKLRSTIQEFIIQFGSEEDNRILFYFAGHGYTIKKAYGEEMGYFVPVDAPDPRIDKSQFMKMAIPMDEFIINAKMIDSKHVLFIFDACFSGSVFSLTRSNEKELSENVAKPVRQFISSGQADETVPDRSIFCEQFIEGIMGSADSDKDSIITTSDLGAFLNKMVSYYSENTQHPQYGKIRNPLLDKGDFIFSPKINEVKDTSIIFVNLNQTDLMRTLKIGLIDCYIIVYASTDTLKITSLLNKLKKYNFQDLSVFKDYDSRLDRDYYQIRTKVFYEFKEAELVRKKLLKFTEYFGIETSPVLNCEQ